MKSLQIAAIEHLPFAEYRHTLADGRVCIRLRTGRDEFDRVTLLYTCNYGGSFEEGPRMPMEKMWCDDVHDVWQAVFLPDDPRLIYYFELNAQGVQLIHDAEGTHAKPENPACAAPFHFHHAYPSEEKPEWARGCIGYQIFPDRFCRVDVPGEEPVEPWGSRRVQNEYRFGGNLKGILTKVDYLQSLGVGVVYMTPLFVSDTSHRYNTFDYFKIDPLLGTMEDLKALAEALHERGIRIVLDGVFNHCGTGFAPFRDALEKGKDSPYYDWFFFDDKYPCGYMTFAENLPYMPKLNMRNPECVAYFLEVGRYWIREAHVDGWRLDVSTEGYSDFWRQYRRAVKAEDPEAILISECWDDAREFCVQGDMFDGTMHYVLSGAIWHFFAERAWTLCQFDEAVNKTMMHYPQEVQDVLWNFLSSHDTPRMLTRSGGRKNAMRAAVFFQMTFPGVPVIYYGDELGMTGGHDPYCRKSMTWERVDPNPMLTYYRQLTAMRGRMRVLREGTFLTWKTGSDGLYAYLRRLNGETVLCLLNTSDERISRSVALPEALAGEKRLEDAGSGRTLQVRAGWVNISLPAGRGMVLTKREEAAEEA